MSGTDGMARQVRSGTLPSPASGPPPVPGIIDGSMTVHAEPGGGVSIRVVIAAGLDPAGQCGLIELVIGAENAGELARAVFAGRGQDQPLPCHVGFGQHAPAA
jgi:hypothetical protein